MREKLIEFTDKPTEYALDVAKLEQLKKSTNLTDRITAILMDEEIGDFGFWESYAREKAEAICEVVDKIQKG